MSQDLAYLVIDRAPMRSRLFLALLMLALDANDRDVTRMTHERLAWMMRTTRSNAQVELARLESLDYIHRFRWGKLKNAQQAYFQVNRKLIFSLPRLPALKGTAGRPVRALQNEPIIDAEARLSRTLERRVEIAANDLREFYALKPGLHLVHLRKLAHKL